MGWSYTQGASKSDVVRSLVKGWETDASQTTILVHTVKGNVLWYVAEILTKVDGTTTRFIGCSLLDSGGDDFGWGSKDMDESCGPVEVGCPLKYLDMVPDPGGYATGWRAKVRAHHDNEAKRRALVKSLKPGSRIRLKEGCSPNELTVTNIKPLRATANGLTYKIFTTTIAAVLD